MNRNAAATKTMNTSKGRAGNACWSSEWSFIEDVDIVLQKVARSSIAGQQAVANHDDASSSSSQSGSNFLRVVR
jgi:hypothetical protein